MRRIACLGVLILCATVMADNYALIVSGGPTPAQNLANFDLGCAGIYRDLASTWMIPYVLSGGGATNAEPPYSPSNPPAGADLAVEDGHINLFIWSGTEYWGGGRQVLMPDDWDGDGLTDVTGPGTWDAFEAALAGLQATITPADELLVYLADHGSQNGTEWRMGFWGTWDPDEWLWTADLRNGSDILAAIRSVGAGHTTIAVAACYSGWLADSLESDDTITLLTQADALTQGWQFVPSLYWGGPCDGQYWEPTDQWYDVLVEGLRHDADGDGRVTWGEVQEWILDHDFFAPGSTASLTLPDGRTIYAADCPTEYPQAFGKLDDTAWLVGDANADGAVDVNDLIVWNAHKFGPGTWYDGDFTGDGVVDVNDLILWNAYKFGATPPQSATAVPEPATVGLLLAGAALLLWRRQYFVLGT